MLMKSSLPGQRTKHGPGVVDKQGIQVDRTGFSSGQRVDLAADREQVFVNH